MQRRAIFWIILMGGLISISGIVKWRFSRKARFNWFQQHYEQIERQLGVRFETPYVLIDGEWREVLAIEAIDKTSPFHTAGAEAGDIIRTNDNQINTVIHRWLYDRQGQSIILILRRGGNGPPLEKRPTKIIKIEVPHIELAGTNS